ncbi:accessory Sec system protein translocase subunit SecY2 [Macrococcoides bohemicum]|uniref:accessory Sec system protein translocase subunit SecY2 n=1 Tax=Macrococcoides bohemicum TaxID=1903056 RepID=UPI00289D86FF|nr:accessory Sec system protein translocase subunit SecY2 [Macrococcus bohemicus]
MKNILNLLLRYTQYKLLYRRIIYTCMIMIIYIIGSNIEILETANLKKETDIFSSVGVSAMGGNYSTASIFSLGLGPYLTSMLIINLFTMRNTEKIMMQTKKERQRKEKALTLFLAVVQSYYFFNIYLKDVSQNWEVMAIGMLVLVTGSMLLVWLSDQNFLYGIGGPMPIVIMSIVNSIFSSDYHNNIKIELSVWIIILVLLLLSTVLLITVERAEYRIDYFDILNISKVQTSFLAWKLNPSGSLAIMLSMSIYMIVKSILDLFIVFFTDLKLEDIYLFDLSHPVGITLFVMLLAFLAYILSLLILNPKRKANEFKKNGNYIGGIKPGSETEKFLIKKAKKISLFSAIIISIIIGIPFYYTLLVPDLSNEIYISIQLLMLIFISINITDIIKTSLYFNRYNSFMNKYW